MQAFIDLLNSSYFGVEVPYAGGYTAYVTSDEERGGFSIVYCQGMMPPHTTDHADTAEQAAAIVANIADLSRAREIESE